MKIELERNQIMLIQDVLNVVANLANEKNRRQSRYCYL